MNINNINDLHRIPTQTLDMPPRLLLDPSPSNTACGGIALAVNSSHFPSIA